MLTIEYIPAKQIVVIGDATSAWEQVSLESSEESVKVRVYIISESEAITSSKNFSLHLLHKLEWGCTENWASFILLRGILLLIVVGIVPWRLILHRLLLIVLGRVRVVMTWLLRVIVIFIHIEV